MLRFTTLITTAILLTGCYRTTEVSGIITNAVTGQPVQGLIVTLTAYNGHEPQDSANPKEVGQSTAATNEKGEYSVEYGGVGIDEVGLSLGSGYCITHFETDFSDRPVANRSREVNIVLDEITGDLDVELEHQIAASDSVFFKVDCDVLGVQGTACCNRSFENVLAIGEHKTVNIPVSAGRLVYIYWDLKKFSNWNASRIDSVYCTPGETAHFKLTY